MPHVAVVPLTMNGTFYGKGEVIADSDLPYNKIRSMTGKGLIDAIGDVGGEGLPTTEILLSTDVIADLANDMSSFAGNKFAISKVETTVPARVRLYAGIASRDADELRRSNEMPEGDHGLLLEVLTIPSELSFRITPAVLCFTGGASVGVTITNLSGVTQDVLVKLTQSSLES